MLDIKRQVERDCEHLSGLRIALSFPVKGYP
jgi:hypothetical protein